MPGENASQPESPSKPFSSRAPWTLRTIDRGEIIARQIISPLRSRASLASGSVLVLLTLFLPIGYQSCGPETKGYELLQGEGDWPTFLGIFLSNYFGRYFYGVLLLLAACTAAYALASLLRPLHGRNNSLNHWLFVGSGILSLFLVSDVLTLLPIAADEFGVAGGAFICASSLLPGKFWPRKLFLRWFGALAILTAIFAGLTALHLLQGDTSMWFVVGIAAVYALVPIGVWCAGVSGRFGGNWRDVRRGLALFYLPAALGNVWFFFVAWGEGVWGFVPCSFGLHLITLGFMRLDSEGRQTEVQPMQGGP